MIGGSLQRRIFIAVTLMMIPIFALYQVIEVRSDIRAASRHTTEDVQDIAAAALPQLKSALIVGDFAMVQETLDGIMHLGHFRDLQLLDPGGRDVLVAGRASVATQEKGAPHWFAALLDVRFPMQSFPVESGGVVYGVLRVEPAAAFLVDELWERTWAAAVAWIVSLAVFMALLRIILERGLKPIAALAQAAHSLGEGDMGSRVPEGDVPEIAATARAFNRMTNKLAEARGMLEERVRQATHDLQQLIMRIPVGVYKLRISPDDTMHFDFVSPRWLELLELDAAAVRDDPGVVMAQVHPDDADSLRRAFDAVKTSLGDFQWEGRLRDGLRARWIRLEAIPTPLDNGDVLWEGIQYDVTAIKEHEIELDRIAHYDPLTQIPNRALLADRMRQAIAQARRVQTTLAICYLDLDGFKPINDALGHEAGDALLVEIAQRLLATVRGGDTVARIGGDEFVLLLADMDRMEECEKTLGRILAAVSAPALIAGSKVSVSASIGIALYPRDDADPDTLLRHADQAMYQAKQSGRNNYIFFDPNLEDAARRHRDLLQQIENGLAGSQFELFYQPKVNMRLGVVIGFEALVRWRHPERDLLPPQEFLPLIEDDDLIIALGDWVIDHALAQLAQWHRQGLDLSVSVNVAPRHLQQGDFAARLRQRLSMHADAPPHRLEIEIVESAALADTHHIAELIDTCREFGVSFALDDFGTGYSSLSYLKNLPAQTLKIDQSFVRDMLVDANDLAIVEGVIGLTEVFRRQVIAEGVETAEHGTLLLNMGCELAQGFGIARPMPANDVEGWLRKWKPDPAWSATEGFRWPRDDLPLVIAASSHRSWVEQMADFLADGTGECPELDGACCRFGTWYAGNGQRRYGRIPAYAAIAPTHDRIHALGREMVGLLRQGQGETARARLPELFALRDELLSQLHELMRAAATL
ncbi:MAG: EAL domain-containing protein [Pseudomonadota bacterium]